MGIHFIYFILAGICEYFFTWAMGTLFTNGSIRACVSGNLSEAIPFQRSIW